MNNFHFAMNKGRRKHPERSDELEEVTAQSKDALVATFASFDSDGNLGDSHIRSGCFHISLRQKAPFLQDRLTLV